MSLLVLCPDPESDALGTKRFLERLRSGWPGTLLLAAGRELPGDLRTDPVLDWVGIPEPSAWQWSDGQAAEWLAIVCRRYDVQAAVGLGPTAGAWLDALPRPVGRWLVLGPQQATPNGYRGLVLGPADLGELIEHLDGELVRRLPIELAPDPDASPRAGLTDLRRHAAWGVARRIVLHWRGQASDGLLAWLRVLVAETGAPIELRLLTSELFDLPRAGLTHSPGEFLFQPAAWSQALALARLVALAPARVTIRLNTQSRAGWIRAGVRAADSGVGWLRRALRALPGGGP